MSELEYEFNGLKFPIASIRQTIDEEWQRLHRSQEFSARVAEAGLNIAEIPVLRNNAITVEESGDGLDPTTLGLLIGLGTALTPKVAMIVEDSWKHVILPRIRQDKGEDVLKEK